MNLSNLERRVTILEKPLTSNGLDPLVLAMEACCLTNSDCGLLQELMSLLRAGFAWKRVEDMMGSDAYAAAFDIAQRVDAELRRLEAPPAR